MNPLRVAPAGALALVLAGCAYFNTMYNAERRFRDAERAHDRGETATARAAWVESIEKAAKSYRAHPDSRWADDALFLIGRARFNLGEFDAARAAMAHLLETERSSDLRSGAHAYLGAASVALGDAAAGAVALDSAAAASGDARPFVQLWRARAAFAANDTARGWSALEAAAGTHGPLGVDASLEMAARAATFADSARARRALERLLADSRAASFADSVHALAARFAHHWGAAWTYAALEPVQYSRWPGEARSRVRLTRARFAAAAGNVDAAMDEAVRIAESGSADLAGESRYLAAQWRLLRLDSVDGVLAVRALLLPAVSHAGALRLLRAIRTTDVLLEFAIERGQPLALFVAAEVARDSLGAPALARALFLTYADAAEDSPWLGKALLAALALSDSSDAAEEVRRRIKAAPHDLYLRAAAGETDASAFAAAEQRLDRSAIALHTDAAEVANRRDLGVTLAAARIDSLRFLARTDSIKLGCGTFIDSLSIRGIRADSVRAACVRGDSSRIALLLTADTALLLEPKTRADSLRRRQAGVVIDTLPRQP